MKKTLIILKTEFINTITRRSFLITLILVPLVPALILGAISLFSGSGDENGGIENLFKPQQPPQLTEGYVDQAGVIDELPEWIWENRFQEYPSTEAAQEATISGNISGYYVIHPDFIKNGEIRYVRKDFNPMSALDITYLIKNIVNYNLLGSDQQRFDAYQDPVRVNYIDLDPDEDERDQSNPFSFYLPYGVTMLFYVLLLTSATLMLNSVAKEKENRMMEILMSSTKPRQIFTGKILGLGLVGLLQMMVWMGSALVMLRLGGTTLNIPANLQLPLEIFFWGIVFFILGYLLYAAIMAGVGALVPNIREASQATFLIVLPIMVPLLMIGMIINEPNATLPVILSLIPFTAPNTIMTRLAAGSVPLWQLLLSIGIMILTTIVIIRAVSGMFRAQLLLTGKKFSFGLYFKALLGRELETTEET